MIRLSNAKECCGCSACESICTHNAIHMKPQELGFLYPEIDESKCVNCRLCEKVCAFNFGYDTSNNYPEPIVYGARHKNVDEIMQSRSGATFAALSDYVLSKGGVVYGAGYTDHFRVVHKRAETTIERDELRGSKYVQSDVRGIFNQVKKDLKNNRLVLFTGTPCQVASLKAFTGKSLLKNLLLVDIVCHGVPSPLIWDDYLKLIEQDNNCKITKVDFRDKKTFGWKEHYESFLLENRDAIKTDTFSKKLFYSHIILRPSCSNCKYCNLNRPSDITLADFWGWEKTNSSFNKDDKGANLVLINTPRGEELFGKISQQLNIIEVDINNAMQPNLIAPSQLHPHYKKFYNDYKKRGFKFVIENIDKYDKEIFATKMWHHVKTFTKRILRWKSVY